jgi:hypothetical protein
MLNSTARHLKNHLIAYLALFVALGGTSYAAVSINGSEIRNHTINPSKFNGRFINGNTRAWAIVRANGTLIAGAGHPKANFNPPNSYLVTWGPKVGRCATQATVDGSSSPTERLPTPGVPQGTPFVAGYATASTVGNGGGETFVETYNQSGQPTPLAFNLTVTC